MTAESTASRRRVRKESKPADTTPVAEVRQKPDYDQISVEILSSNQYSKVFGARSKYPRILAKIRNSAVGDEIAWRLALPLVKQVVPNGYEFDSNLLELLFIEARNASKEQNPNQDVIMDNYRRKRRRVLGNIEDDEEFERHEALTPIFERGFFGSTLARFKSRVR